MNVHSSFFIYLLPLVAVFLGYLISLFLKPNSSTSFQLLLSFSGAYLLSITVLELLPEVYKGNTTFIGLFIMGGLLLQIFLEFLSQGVEHGHLHHSEHSTKFPFFLFISLSLHSLLEGFPLTTTQDLIYGVVIHKIPVAAILATFMVNSQYSKKKIFSLLALFGLMTPIGSYLQIHISFFLQYQQYINALVIGIFLHVSTTIIFEGSKNHSFNASKLGAIITGILLAFFL